MKNSVISALAAVLIAAALPTGGAFAAEGEYYEGISPHHGIRPAGSLDTLRTGSINRYGFPSLGSAREFRNPTNRTVGSGDYYYGVNRPN